MTHTVRPINKDISKRNVTITFLLFLIISCWCSSQTIRDIRPIRTFGNSKDGYILGTYGMTFLSRKYIIVSDKLEYNIKCFNRNGIIIRSTGKKGHKDGEFKGPGPINARSRNVAIADFSSNRIQIISSSFQHKNTFFMENPIFDLHFDDNEHLWIGMLPNDKGESLVEVDIKGQVINKFILRGLSQNEFENVYQMTIDKEGQIVIVYLVQNKVEIWNISGMFIAEFPVPGIPSRPNQIKISEGLFSSSILAPEDNLFVSVAVDNRSRIYILSGTYTEHPYRDIYVLNNKGILISRLTIPETSKGIFINNINELYSIENSRTLIRIYNVGKY